MFSPSPTLTPCSEALATEVKPEKPLRDNCTCGSLESNQRSKAAFDLPALAPRGCQPPSREPSPWALVPVQPQGLHLATVRTRESQ